MWQDDKILKLFNIVNPILLAPMAGAADAQMAIAVNKAGGLGSIACAMLSLEQIQSEVNKFRAACPHSPINLNFFCHEETSLENEQELQWLKILRPYYSEFKINEDVKYPFAQRNPFNVETCKLMEEIKPEVISFHFGLPSEELFNRLKKIGCKIISSATTVEEARWLEANGCDAIIAQGFEAGGHRGSFLVNNMNTQVGTMALIPLIVDSVNIPVIGAGGIADARGIAAAMILGASAVQIGTAYLYTHESTISEIYRKMLLSKQVEETALTNIFSGKPARGIVNRIMKEIGPMTDFAPPFPFAGKALAPLKYATEKSGSADFISLWSGQAAGLIKNIESAQNFTEKITSDAFKILDRN